MAPIQTWNRLVFRFIINERVARGLSALRHMFMGAAALVLVEKWRRGVFTNDDLWALLILSILIGFMADLVRRKAANPGEVV
ncbi:hypothetical protein ABE444_05115 [Brevundimonas pondensis]|uniref:hypothetical protein n=1 Tax=Brevundimonas pondensis TaxID=2774189 RepID=UPI003207CE50